ncbi:hypothetical protein BDA99DRAFT_604670 [Phascolomyces articulosus]|uniref:Uncharacterized protein n=1 Tax=Phascolomyces articulosus TaxID=60185 RepID=A0AAD5PEA1_9FUNG|nr:hypothetical protein BDA99DRAFT_604670 [Phascolomyces articulosus]
MKKNFLTERDLLESTRRRSKHYLRRRRTREEEHDTISTSTATERHSSEDTEIRNTSGRSTTTTSIPKVTEAFTKRGREQFEEMAQHLLQTVIRLFYSTFFPITDQTEGDMIRRIWNFIDYALDNMKVDIRTKSAASAERRNEQRPENGWELQGHKTNLLLKVAKGEIGCAEVGKKDHVDAGSKETKELGLKAPKMLKDQLYNLSKVYPTEDFVLLSWIIPPPMYARSIKPTFTISHRQLLQLGMIWSYVGFDLSRELVDQTIKKLNEPSVLGSVSFANVVNPSTAILPCVPSPKLSPKKPQ